MKLVHAVLALAVLVPVAIGCGGSEGDAERAWDPDLQAASGPNGSCAPRTCQAIGKKCGAHDDGCGGTLDCGKCVDSVCTPKTCEELGKTCGKQDDACGGFVECGPCTACAPDANEGEAGNNTPDKASDLGALTDTPASNRNLPSLTVGDGDEDWYKFTVSDGGFMGNPEIVASVSGASVEVGVFYMCNSAENFAECPNATDKPDTTVGMGCVGKDKATLTTSCKGINENGTAWVRVRKSAPGGAQACLTYTLDVKVNE